MQVHWSLQNDISYVHSFRGSISSMYWSNSVSLMNRFCDNFTICYQALITSGHVLDLQIDNLLSYISYFIPMNFTLYLNLVVIYLRKSQMTGNKIEALLLWSLLYVGNSYFNEKYDQGIDRTIPIQKDVFYDYCVVCWHQSLHCQQDAE